MKSTNKIANLPDRQCHDNKEISIHGYPETSSRAGYYHQYLNQKNMLRDDFLEYAITDDEENRFYSSEGDGYCFAGEGNA